MNANDVILDYKQILRHLISDYILIFSSPRIMLLQSHVEERSGTQTETTVRERVVKLLQQYK